MARDQRRLAAIVSTDVVGYSRLMGLDEAGTLGGLKAHLRELVDPKIAEYGGRTVKSMGDGLLLEFPSVVDAVRCAVDVQRGMAERNATVPEATRIVFRVGINVGDIIIDGEDIFGDGVNVAARLQTLAEPGGICVSRVVRDQVLDKLSFAFDDLGAQEMKNIARAIEVYRVVLEGNAAAGPAQPALRPPAPAKEPPSIAVLPFVNMSRDEDDEYFADGLAEELLNVLSKIRGLRVAARTSSFQFKGKNDDIVVIGRKLNVATLLEGSVRKSGNRLRISVQLVKVADGYHLWSERYDRELTDIFAVQDDIAQSVVVELRRALLDSKTAGPSVEEAASEVMHAAQGRGEDAVAYQLFLEARSRANRITKDDNARAIELFGQAVALQPDFALAWAGLSDAHGQSVAAGFAMPADGYAQARAAANRALALAPDLVEGLVALGQVLASDDLDWKGADATFRKAIELAPGNAAGLHSASWLATVYGRIDEALALAQRIVSLDPLAVNGHVRLARLLTDSGAYDEAEAALGTARQLKPAGPYHHASLGRIRLYQRRYAEALAEFEQESVDWERKSGIALARSRLGPPEAAEAALQDIITHDAETAAIQIAEIYAYRDEKDAAFAWLERAYVQHDHGVSLLRSFTTFRGLHDDPRWRAYLAKIGLAD